jgi:catechol 2,3-dioxygenase-like lactoylglutathione lyase family enzyme
MTDILESTFVLAVRDLDASKTFYLEKLGFAEDLSVDGWAFLSRGACKLRLGACPDATPMSQVPDHSWFAYLHVRDVADLYAESVKNGVEIWHKLADKPWGMREFAVVTPDGHRMVFGERMWNKARQLTAAAQQRVQPTLVAQPQPARDFLALFLTASSCAHDGSQQRG